MKKLQLAKKKSKHLTQQNKNKGDMIMEIKNIDELIEKLLRSKAFTIAKIQKTLSIGYSRACQILDRLDKDGLILSLNEKEKVAKQGKLEEIKTIIKEILDDKIFGIDACYFDENGELDESKLDACFVDALRFVVNEQKASVAFLQKKLQIGYSRAARIIDMMEDLDFISSSSTIPRIVFITKEEFQQIFEKAS